LHPAQVAAQKQQQQQQPAATKTDKELADSIAADSSNSTDTMLKLESEEIQKLLKVVDLYLAGGKQQRDVRTIRSPHIA
jgi:hypothetical protein